MVETQVKLSVVKDRFAGVKPVNTDYTDHSDYVAKRVTREEEVGMFETSLIFKDVYDGELVPGDNGQPSGFVYEFKQIEAPTKISLNKEWYTSVVNESELYIDCTNVVNYSEVYRVFIKRKDINEAFRTHLIDTIMENLILFNRIISEKSVDDFAIIDWNQIESYKIASRCVIFYNLNVVPALNVQKIVMFSHTVNGRPVVQIA